ncbi:MAG: cell division protein FtsH, partial [Jatrophihabitantaceae bacterium]
EAWEILVQYRDVLDAMVLELAEKETLAKDDLERILAPVRKRPPHNSFGGFGKRTPSDRPPIDIPPSLRKSPNGVPANGNPANGNPANGNGAQPGVFPNPVPPLPPGVFGPSGASGPPYGGYPPPPTS